MQWPIYGTSRISKQSGRVAVRGAIRACSLRILHARTNEVCFVGGNLRGSIGRGGGWRVMYTRARGVEVGKWPARRARRPTDLERYRPAAGPTPAAARRHGQHSRRPPAVSDKNTPLFAHDQVLQPGKRTPVDNGTDTFKQPTPVDSRTPRRYFRWRCRYTCGFT